MSEETDAPLEDAAEEQLEAEVLRPSTALATRGERSLAVQDPLRRYLAEIASYPLLDADEEHELAVRYREQDDLVAARRLATSNLRLVVHIAMDFHRTAVSLLDLIQEGNIGLLQAVQRFDPYRKVRFSAYASWWIRAYILKYLIDHWSLVRVGTTNVRRKLLFNLRKEQDRLEAKGIRPDPALLAKRLGVSEKEVIAVQQGMTRDVSLDAPVGEESDASFSDLVPSSGPPVDEFLAEEEFHAALREKMNAFAATLDERDRDLFQSRLLSDSPETLQQIGERHGISREAMRQRERKIVDRLRRYLQEELADFRGLEFMRGEPAEGSSGSRTA